jgi:hypothetical protein
MFVRQCVEQKETTVKLGKTVNEVLSSETTDLPTMRPFVGRNIR